MALEIAPPGLDGKFPISLAIVYIYINKKKKVIYSKNSLICPFFYLRLLSNRDKCLERRKIGMVGKSGKWLYKSLLA